MQKRSSSNLSGNLRVFTKQYARKAQRGVEPNDRRYDSKVEKRMKTLVPQNWANF
jgi:hypothetical protein